MSEVINLDELRAKATPVEEIPGWREGETIRIRLRRPSLHQMILSGAIPNELLAIAASLLNNEHGANPFKLIGEDVERLKEFAQLQVAVAKAALVEPTYEEFCEAAGGMTDDQLLTIFLYVMWGPRALNIFRFRSESGPTPGGNGKGVGSSA